MTKDQTLSHLRYALRYVHTSLTLLGIISAVTFVRVQFLDHNVSINVASIAKPFDYDHYDLTDPNRQEPPRPTGRRR